MDLEKIKKIVNEKDGLLKLVECVKDPLRLNTVKTMADLKEIKKALTKEQFTELVMRFQQCCLEINLIVQLL